jgi:hypothetical protein
VIDDQESICHEDPAAECHAVAKSIGEKADKNKRIARRRTLALTLSTALVPVFILVPGDIFLLSKVAPSVLAAVSAVLAALNQFDRPHQRWVLYRRYERLVQAEGKRYRFAVAPYDGEDRDTQLGRAVAQLEIDLQAEWEGLIPSRNEIPSTAAVSGRE